MTARHVVADDLLGKIARRQWEITRRVQEGTLDPNGVCVSLQSIIEGNRIAIDPGDLRAVQATVLYDAGFGEELGYVSFEAYLETIPEIPEWPKEWGDHFDRIILVDRRPSLTTTCRLLYVAYDGDDETFVPFDPETVREDVYWICCQDGKRNRGRTRSACRESFVAFEKGLSARRSLALFAQDRDVLKDHTIDLPGSVHRDGWFFCACLGLWDDTPELFWRRVDVADPECGSGSCGGLVT